MRRLTIGIGLVLVLAAVGVGVAIAASSGGQGPRAVTQAPRKPPAPAARLLSRPWQLRAVRGKGRVVVIRYTEGDCWGAGRARVTETKKSVTIELLQPYSGGAGVACPQFLIVRSLSVHLKAALGRRRLLPAPLGTPPG